MLKKCPKNFQMSDQNWGCLDKMSEVNFSPAETLFSYNSFLKFHVKTFRSQNMTVVYPKLC